MTRVHMAVIALLFGAAFAIGSIVRGDVAPGLVGGALAVVLVFLVLRRVQEHNAAVLRRRQRERQS